VNDDDLVGRAIDGKYTILRLIGRGGMGSVYEGRNIQTHKRVAIKLLSSPELVHNPDLVRRFFQEARAGAVVESEHVVQVYDSGTDPTTSMPYMVMELLQGEDLDACVKRLRALPPAVAARVVLQAASGLAKAHSLGIVHRDIKPANLFLSRRESGELTVKLLDFGVAKVRMQHFQETQAGLTATGSLLGTPIYMSPEQAKGRTGVEASSDVWSLGVVLYELLSGALPYSDATTLGELIISICTEDIPLLQDRAAWVPPELAEVTHRAMSRDMAHRYADAGQLRDALLALLPDGRLTPDMFTSVTETQRALIMPRLEIADSGMLRARSRDGLAVTQAAPTSSQSGLVIGLVMLLIVVIAGGAALFWRMSKKPAPVASAESAAPVVLLVSATSDPVRPSVKSFKLAVSPGRVKVSIDGHDTPVVEDAVVLSGVPGDTRTVRLELDGKSRDTVVAVTANGLVPTRVELPAGGVVPSQKRGDQVKPAVKPSGSEPGKTTKPKPKLENEWPG
jgi:serine/threonine-protein kinase